MSHVAFYGLWLINKISTNGQKLVKLYLVQKKACVKYPTCPYT